LNGTLLGAVFHHFSHYRDPTGHVPRTCYFGSGSSGFFRVNSIRTRSTPTAGHRRAMHAIAGRAIAMGPCCSGRTIVVWRAPPSRGVPCHANSSQGGSTSSLACGSSRVRPMSAWACMRGPCVCTPWRAQGMHGRAAQDLAFPALSPGSTRTHTHLMSCHHLSATRKPAHHRHRASLNPKP
jgi:hypothetical protein